jgi:sugar-specific transcriptional regulator TrmB/DNA-binding CsgD family transcriptional regulator
MLESLGVPADDDRVYLVLLADPGLTRSELAERSGLGGQTVQRALARFAELGVVSRLAGRPVRYLAVAPDTAVEVLLARQHQAAAVARAEAQTLLETMPAARLRRDEDQLEIVAGRQAIGARVRQLLDTAAEELLVLDPPPIACAPANGDWPGLLRRGVRSRRVYEPTAIEHLAEDEEAAGAAFGVEQVRICDQLPTKLLIADQAVAMIPFTDEGATIVDSALVVRSPTLLVALVRLFELLWQASVPLSRREGGLSAEARIDERLLLLLAAGLKDEAIARQLGVSLRTVHRRTSELLDGLGARTRFQAGMQAVRRGLLVDKGS